MPHNTSTYIPDLFAKKDSLSLFSSFPEDGFDRADATTREPAFVPTEEKLSEKPRYMDMAFLLFLFCFLIISQVFSKRGKMLSSMLNGLLHQKTRQSIFFETTGNEQYSKLLLCFQSSVLLSVFSFCWFTHDYPLSGESHSNAFLMLGGGTVLFILFFIYKWLSYTFIGKVFFHKDQLSSWIDNYISLICLSGVILFIPILLLFYIDSIYYYCYFLILFYLFIVIIIIIYKSYVLFFHDIGLFPYLFLYLCAQEIVPLFLLYKGLIFMFNTVERNALWL